METRPYHVVAYRLVTDQGQESEQVHYDHEVIGATLEELISNIEQLLFEVMMDWAKIDEHDMRYVASIRTALGSFQFPKGLQFDWRASKTPYGRSYQSIDFDDYRVEFRQDGGKPLPCPWTQDAELANRLCGAQDRLITEVRQRFDANVAQQQQKAAERDG